ncbi:MAG: MSMEG_4193 family putative phosphomutase [Actinomycetota bacterium]
MTTFFLVRHAVTDHTGQRISGWLEGIDLSDDGREQAKALAERLADAGFAAVYSSPIERTMDTARPIADAQGLTVKVRRSLGEVEYGGWTNRSMKVLARTKLWQQVQSFPSGARFPDGEAMYEVQTRAVAELEKLRQEHPKDKVCVVTHGDVIRLVTAHYLGVHIDLFQRIVVAPASLTVIAVSDMGPRVLTVNSKTEWGGEP